MDKKKGILSFLSLCAIMSVMVVSASADVTKVICVPWQGNIHADHVTWDGKNILLKAVVHTESSSDNLTYTMSFGDNSPDFEGALSGRTKYNIEIFHAYTGALETPYVATLTVNDGVNKIVDQYRVRIKLKDRNAEKAVSVDETLWQLYKLQHADGHWFSYGSYYYFATASSVHAFEFNNHLATNDPEEDPYVETVRKGLAHIFTTLWARANGDQPYGDSDSKKSETEFYINKYKQFYQTGMIMDAIIKSKTPDADSGFDFDGDGVSDTYKEVVQGQAEMLRSEFLEPPLVSIPDWLPEDISVRGANTCGTTQDCPEGYYFCKKYCQCIPENPDCSSKLKCGKDQVLDRINCQCIPKL